MIVCFFFCLISWWDLFFRCEMKMMTEELWTLMLDFLPQIRKQTNQHVYDHRLILTSFFWSLVNTTDGSRCFLSHIFIMNLFLKARHQKGENKESPWSRIVEYLAYWMQNLNVCSWMLSRGVSSIKSMYQIIKSGYSGKSITNPYNCSTKTSSYFQRRHRGRRDLCESFLTHRNAPAAHVFLRPISWVSVHECMSWMHDEGRTNAAAQQMQPPMESHPHFSVRTFFPIMLDIPS